MYRGIIVRSRLYAAARPAVTGKIKNLL
jgi:hypothetical protein